MKEDKIALNQKVSDLQLQNDEMQRSIKNLQK